MVRQCTQFGDEGGVYQQLTGIWSNSLKQEVIYCLLPKFQVRLEGFQFYSLRKSDKGADTDLIYESVCLLTIKIARLGIAWIYQEYMWPLASH